MRLSNQLVAIAGLISGVALAAEPVRLGDFEVGFGMRFARPGVVNRYFNHGEMLSLQVQTNSTRLTATWKGHKLCGSNFVVTAVFDAQPDGGWSWNFAYQGNSATNLDVEQIVFPILDAPRTDKTAIVFPRMIGQVRRPAWKSLPPSGFVCEAVPHAFRFIAAYDEAATSVYLDERGARGFAGKMIARQGPKPNTVRLIALHEMALTSGANSAGSLPFGGTIRAYKGGWYEAARIYREWVRTQDWAKAARERPVSPKLRDIALWMWNRGSAEQVISPAERFQDETGLNPAIDWYWWHKIPYDHGYPNFWPPREGEAAFRKAVARMKRRGIFSQVYTNGMTWDCDDPSFAEQGGLESVIISRRGSKAYERHVFNTHTGHALAYMCGEGKRYQDVFVDLTRQLASCGLDGLYMDMIASCTLASCWNPAHSHPQGGGTAQADGYRAFFRRVKRESPTLLLSSEEPSEEYLDCNEAAISLWQTPERLFDIGAPACEAVPVYVALHHGEIALFGSYAIMGGVTPWDPTWPTHNKWKDESYWAKIYPQDQFALEFATGPSMGIQPCVHNLTLEQIEDPKLAADWTFVKQTARFYHANRDLLYDGELLAPGRMQCDIKPLNMAIRGIYTSEKNLYIAPSRQPAVKHNFWRAPDGRKGLIVVNWTSEPRQWRVSAPAGEFNGTLPPRTWQRIDIQ